MSKETAIKLTARRVSKKQSEKLRRQFSIDPDRLFEICRTRISDEKKAELQTILTYFKETD